MFIGLIASSIEAGRCFAYISFAFLIDLAEMVSLIMNDSKNNCAFAFTTLAVPEAILRDNASNAEPLLTKDTALLTSTLPTFIPFFLLIS